MAQRSREVTVKDEPAGERGPQDSEAKEASLTVNRLKLETHSSAGVQLLVRIAEAWGRQGYNVGTWLVCAVASLAEEEGREERKARARAVPHSESAEVRDGDSRAKEGKQVEDHGQGQKSKEGGEGTLIGSALREGPQGGDQAKQARGSTAHTQSTRRLTAALALRAYTMLKFADERKHRGSGERIAEGAEQPKLSIRHLWSRLTGDVEDCFLFSPSLFLRVLLGVLRLIRNLPATAVPGLYADPRGIAPIYGGMATDELDLVANSSLSQPSATGQTSAMPLVPATAATLYQHPLAVPRQLLRPLFATMDPVFAAALSARIVHGQAELFGSLPEALCWDAECASETGTEAVDWTFAPHEVISEDAGSATSEAAEAGGLLSEGAQGSIRPSDCRPWLKQWCRHMVEALWASFHWEWEEQQWLWYLLAIEAFRWHRVQRIRLIQAISTASNLQERKGVVSSSAETISADAILGLQHMLMLERKPCKDMKSAVDSLNRSRFGAMPDTVLQYWQENAT